MQLSMVAIQMAKCKSLLIVTFSINAWADEGWTFVVLWFCIAVKSSGVLGECMLPFRAGLGRVKGKAGILTIYTMPSVLVACPL